MQVLTIEEVLQNIVKDFNSKAPPGINAAFISVEEEFALITMKDHLLLGVVIGILIGLGVAFVVLIVIFKNILLSLITIVFILKMLLLMFSAIFLTGRQFNISESISIVVFLPYTVEYVVWMVHAYLHSSGESFREDRIANAFRSHSETVVMGALITLVCVLTIAFCESAKLRTQAIVLVTANIGSLITSCIFLPSLLFLIGPQGESLKIRCRKNFWKRSRVVKTA